MPETLTYLTTRYEYNWSKHSQPTNRELR